MKKLFLHILLIVIGSMAFTTIVVQIPNPIFNDVGSKDSWINFFGAITGGLLTLYGVWWTIIEQKKELMAQEEKLNEQRREDLAIQYKPYISLLPCTSLKFDIEINNIAEYKEPYYYFTFFYKNTGNGESYNTTMNIEHDNTLIDLDDISEVQIYPDNVIHNFQFKLKKEELNFSNNTAVFNVSFNYTDMFSVYKYSMCYQLIYVIENNECKNMYILILHDQCKTLKIKK